MRRDGLCTSGLRGLTVLGVRSVMGGVLRCLSCSDLGARRIGLLRQEFNVSVNHAYVATLAEELLAQDYPFLRWPRRVVQQQKVEWFVPLRAGGPPICEYNYLQVFMSQTERSLIGLIGHLNEIEQTLKKGKRHWEKGRDNPGELFLTAGTEWWNDGRYEVHGYTLLIFADRFLQYHGDAWLSDVGVKPTLSLPGEPPSTLARPGVNVRIEDREHQGMAEYHHARRGLRRWDDPKP